MKEVGMDGWKDRKKITTTGKKRLEKRQNE